MPINNRYPLAINYDSNGNASGLAEFDPQTKDLSDVCETDPTTGQVLVYTDEGNYCPSTLPAPGEFTGNLSDVGGVCTATPEFGQVLTFSDTGGGIANGVWCASTVQTGGGGGSVTSVNGVGPTGGDVLLDLSDVSGPNGTYFDPAGGTGEPGSLKIPNGGLGIGPNDPAAGGFVLGTATPLGSTFVVGPTGAGTTTIGGSNGTITTGPTGQQTVINGTNGKLTVGPPEGFTQILGTNGTLTTGPGSPSGQTQIDGTNGDLTIGLEGTSQTIIDGADGTITTGDGTAANTTTINGTTGNVTVGAGTNQTTIGVTTGVTVGDSTAQDHVDIQTDGCIFVGSGTGDGSGITLKSTGKIHFSDKPVAESLLVDAGDVCYDSDTETLAIQANANTIIHVGEDQMFRAKAIPEITAGQAVYVSAATGSNLELGVADNEYSQDDLRILGIAINDIGAGDLGFVQTFGKATLNITSLIPGGNVGDPVFLGKAGALVTTKPSTDSVVRIGKIEQDANPGVLFIDVQHGFTANEIDDINVDINSVVITDGTASAVSSVSGASGSLVYFSGTTPRPVLTGVPTILGEANYTIQPGETYATETYVTTRGYITNIGSFDLDDLQNVANVTPQDESTLFYNASEGVWSAIPQAGGGGGIGQPLIQGTVGDVTVDGKTEAGITTLVFSNVLTTPIGTTGKGDVNTGFVFLSGTNASSTEVVGDNFGKIWVTGPDQDISDGNSLVYFSANDTTSGTAAIPITDNGLEALQTLQTPSYFQVISSGNITGVADEALTELGWASTGTYALSDPGGNLSLESGDSADRSVINVSGDGVYQIDATVRISNTTERGGIVFRIYRDTGSGFTDIPELRASNYASRGTGSGEGITNGSCSINTILSLNANDRLQFRAQPKTAGATSIIQQEGTYLRIIKIA